MKIKNYILTLFILFLSTICYAQSYKVFNPNNYTQNNSIGSAKELILFIVDFSNSMNETIQGTTKIELALKHFKYFITSAKRYSYGTSSLWA